MSALLAAEDLELAYGEISVCRDLAFEVHAGEIVTLLGANGAGKSTTLRAVAGVLTPRAGAIRLRGQDITRLPSHARADLGIALVPEGRHVFPYLTVRENLELGAFKHRRDHAKVRGLMAGPKLLILDEPSLGLAPRLVSERFELVRGLRDQGLAILLSEQNARLSLAIADRGYVIENGSVALSGSGQDLLRSKEVADRYLGVGAKPEGGSSAQGHKLVDRLRQLLQT